MFYKIRTFLRRFFIGRYGFDALSWGLVAVYFILSLLNVFFDSLIIYLVSVAFLVLAIVRALSKNHYARRRENARFTGFLFKLKNIFKPRPNDPYYVFKKCPRCHQKLRFPRKRGKHIAVCPKCKNEFKVKVK